MDEGSSFCVSLFTQTTIIGVPDQLLLALSLTTTGHTQMVFQLLTRRHQCLSNKKTVSPSLQSHPCSEALTLATYHDAGVSTFKASSPTSSSHVCSV
eukprot:1161138-Pelagomonas_calceolata.AAC.6